MAPCPQADNDLAARATIVNTLPEALSTYNLLPFGVPWEPLFCLLIVNLLQPNWETFTIYA